MRTPANPYYPQDFSATPSAWDLVDGEQLNLHHSSLELVEFEPLPSDFPGQVVASPGVVSFTGPLDLTTWHKATYPAEWAATGGLQPAGVPHISVEHP